MPEERRVEIRFEVDDRGVVHVMKRVDDGLDKVERQAKKTARGMQALARQSLGAASSLKLFRQAAALAAPAALVLGIRKATQAFLDFQLALNQVQAVAGATASQMGQLRQQAFDLGTSTKFSATEAAQAQFFLAQAGLSVKNVMEALPGVLQLATAGNLDLARAADIATDVMSGYGLTVDQLGRINDVMATTAANANTNILQMGTALTYAGPVAAAAGRPIEETSAAIGLLASAGFKGELGGTALRGSIARLLSPSKEAATIIKNLGVEITDSTGKMRPLTDIVKQFGEAGLTAGQAMEIFGLRAGPGMLALISRGAPALERFIGLLNDSEGAAQDMAETMVSGFVRSALEMLKTLQAMTTQIGGALSPVLAELAVLVTASARSVGDFVESIAPQIEGLAGWMNRMQHEVRLVSAVIGGVLVAGVGLAVVAFGKLAVATTVATGGLNLIIPAIAGVIGTLALLRPGHIAAAAAAEEAAGRTSRAYDLTKQHIDETREKLIELRRQQTALLRATEDYREREANRPGSGRLKDGRPDVLGHANMEKLKDVTAAITEEVRKLEEAQGDALRQALLLGEGLKEAYVDVGKVSVDRLNSAMDELIEKGQLSTDTMRHIGQAIFDTIPGAESLARELSEMADKSELSPEALRTLEAMGDALGNIFTAFARGTLEADSLGKALEEVSDASLPELIALIKGLKDEGRLTDQAMRSIGQRAAELREAGAQLNPELERMANAYGSGGRGAEEMSDAVKNLIQSLQGLPVKKVSDDLKNLRTAWDNLTPDQRTQAMHRYADALSDLADKNADLTESEMAVVEQLRRHLDLIREIERETTNADLVVLGQQIVDTNAGGAGAQPIPLEPWRELADLLEGRVATGLEGIGHLLDQADDEFDDNAQRITDWSGAFRRAFEGGGNLFGGFASGVLESMDGVLSGVTEKLSSVPGIMGQLGNLAGGALSGGIAIAVQVGLSALSKWIDGWWKSQEKRINDFRDFMHSVRDDLLSGDISPNAAANIARMNEEDQQAALEHYRWMEELKQTFLDAGLTAEESHQWEIRRLNATTAAELRQLYVELAEVGKQARFNALRDELIGVIPDEVIDNFTRLKGVWDSLDPDEKVQAWHNYADALWEAYKAGVAMEDWRERQALTSEAARADVGLLVGPTQADIDAFENLTAVWNAMNTDEQAAAMSLYADALWQAHESGIELTESQMEIARTSDLAKDSVDGLTDSVDELNDALQAAADAFGITTLATHQTNVDELNSSLQLLADNGIDAVAQMSESAVRDLGKMLLAARDAGVEIPEALQPILDIFLTLPDVIEEVVDEIDHLGEAAGRLGVTLERDLGVQVAQLAADLDLLSAEGIDAVSEMSDTSITKFGEMLLAAQNAGIEIPAALQPIIDAFVDLRIAAIDAQLTDLRETLELRNLQREERGLRKQADEINARYNTEIDAIERAHDARMAALDAEEDAIRSAHTVRMDALKAQEDAAKASYKAEKDRLDGLKDAAHDVHTARMDALKAQEEAAERAYERDASRLDKLKDALVEAFDLGGLVNLRSSVAGLTSALSYVEQFGVTAGEAISSMSDETVSRLGEMLSNARRAGIEIPESLRPILEMYTDLQIAAAKMELAERRESLELRNLNREADIEKRRAAEIEHRYDAEVDAAKYAHEQIMDILAERKETAERDHRLTMERLNTEIDIVSARYDAELEGIEFSYEAAKDRHKQAVQNLDDLRDALGGLRRAMGDRFFLVEPFSHTDEIDSYIDKLKEIGAITEEMADSLRKYTRVNTSAMDEVLEKYKLQSADLGEQYQKQVVFDELQKLARDIRILESGGADISKIVGTSTELHTQLENAVKKAIGLNVEIPSTLKDAIEALRDLPDDIDNLTDEEVQQAKNLMIENAKDLMEPHEEILAQIETFEEKQRRIAKTHADEMERLTALREEREKAMNDILDSLKDGREAAEDAYRDEIDDIKTRRKLAEDSLRTTIADIETRRADETESIYERIRQIELQREKIEDERWHREDLRLKTEIKRLETEQYALMEAEQIGPAVDKARTAMITALDAVIKQRDTVEQTYRTEIERITSERKLAEDTFKAEIDRITAERKLAEDTYRAEIARIKGERKLAEDTFKAEIDRIRSERTIAEDNLRTSIADIEKRRADELEPIYTRIREIELRREEVEDARWKREDLRLKTEISRLETEKAALIKAQQLGPAIQDALDSIAGVSSATRKTVDDVTTVQIAGVTAADSG